MNEKEKLVELIRSGIHDAGHWWHMVIPHFVVERIADRIIAHGVTVQEWISVKDRLPKNGERVLVHLNSGSTYIADFDNSGVFPDWHKPNSNRLYCYATHWTPLPRITE